MCAGLLHSNGEGHEQDGSDSQQKETEDEGKTVQYADVFFAMKTNAFFEN